MRKLFILISLILLLPATARAQRYCFNRASQRYGLPVSLIKAVAYTESSFNPQAIDYDSNGTYDYGVMQINTIWYKQLKPYWNNLADPCYNVMVGSWILYRCVKRFGSIKQGLACYNSGSPDVKAEKKYIDEVLAFQRKF
jgi:soluble lytic murein transglycosylase-like protein